MSKAPRNLTCLLPLSLALIAGGTPLTAAEKTVTFGSWSPIVETTNQMIAAFNQKNPDIKIEAKIFNYPDYLVDLQTRAAGNSLPDIIGLEPGALTQQYKQFLMPLQDLAAKVWGNDWKEMFYPIAIEQARLGNATANVSNYLYYDAGWPESCHRDAPKLHLYPGIPSPGGGLRLSVVSYSAPPGPRVKCSLRNTFCINHFSEFLRKSSARDRRSREGGWMFQAWHLLADCHADQLAGDRRGHYLSVHGFV